MLTLCTPTLIHKALEHRPGCVDVIPNKLLTYNALGGNLCQDSEWALSITQIHFLVLGKLDMWMQKNEPGPLYHTQKSIQNG
jgi:hypothetical protein